MSSKSVEALKAARRLSYITPDKVRKVLRHDRYWTPDFLSLYLKRCEETRCQDLDAAETLIEPASALVQRIPFAHEADRLTWDVRARSLQAEIVALAGCGGPRFLDRAESILDQARSLLVSGKVQRIAGAEHFRRRAAVLRLQGRTEEAAEWLHRAVDLYRNPEDDPRGLAEALVLHGLIDTPHSIVGLAEAASLVSPSPAKCRAFENGLFDAAWWLLDQKVDQPRLLHDVLEATLSWIYIARRKWFKGDDEQDQARELLQETGRHVRGNAALSELIEQAKQTHRLSGLQTLRNEGFQRLQPATGYAALFTGPALFAEPKRA